MNKIQRRVLLACVISVMAISGASLLDVGIKITGSTFMILSFIILTFAPFLTED